MVRSRLSLAALLAAWLFLAAPALRAQKEVPVPALPVQKEVSNGFLDQVTAHFAQWDQDHNGELSASELDAVVSDPKTTGDTAAAIVALKQATRSKKYTVPALTLAYLGMLPAAPEKDQPNFPRMYADARRKIAKTRHDLFVSGAPKLESIRQGRLGDCFCLAPLGAMLARSPQEVADRFVHQPDDSYQFVFGATPVHVTLPTDAEMALTAASEQDGLWVSLYEKAVGTDKVLAKSGGAATTASPIDAIGKGGSAGTILARLTGHKISRFSCRTAKAAATPADREPHLQALRKQLLAAILDHRLITCGTAKTTTPGITPNHAYAVLGYEEKTDTLRLWNPHGDSFTPKGEEGLDHGYARKHGVFSLPLADFVMQFTGVAFETSEPVAP